jgi:ankyrin repeat protein
LACARVFVFNLQDEKWIGWFGVSDRGTLLSGPAGTLWLIRSHALPLVAIDTGSWSTRSVSAGAPIPAHDIFAQIAAHDIASLKLGLATKQNVNKATESGWTPLMAAVWWSDEEAVELLLAAGANVESSDQRGWHPLRIAAEKGDQKIVRLLLRSGADIDFAAEAYPWTPNHFPVESGESYNSTVLRTDKRTALHGAAASNQSEMVALLLKAGANWKTLDGEGMTPLHLAVRFASAQTVSAFIEGGADLAIVDSKGVPAAEMARNRSDLTELTTKVAQTPAMLTAQMESLLTGPENLDEFRRLLAAGANPASGGETKIPLIYQAAKWGKWNYVKAALEHSIDLGLPICYGVDRPTTVGTVLFYEALAQDTPRIDVARKLLELGAKPDGEAYAWTKISTLMLAWKSGDLEILNHLLDLGIVQFPTVHFDEQLLIKAVIAAKDEVTLKLLMPYTQKLRPGSSSPMIYLEDVTGDGRTPLMAAVVARWTRGVEILVQAGADTEVKDTSGKSLQDYASADAKIALALNARRTQDENRPGGAEAVEAVVKNDPNLEQWPINDAVLKYRDFRNWTVLHHALYRKRFGFARKLVDAGIALDVLTRSGQSALTFAAAMGNEEIVSVTLKAGAPVNLAGVDALTPLYQGVRSGNVRIVTLLLAAGANPQRTVFEKKTTPILGAAGVAKSIPVIEALLAAGSSITDVDSNGLGILEYAVWSDDAGVIQYLVDKGAQWRESSSDPDYHPLVTAAKYGKKESVRKLLELGKRDPRALAVAGDPEIRAMLEDDAKIRGSRVVEDEELWPTICKDRENWKTRAEAHIAKGGNVNYRSREWTPLILALDEVYPALVKWLLSKGADPKIFPINKYDGVDIYGELLGGWSRSRLNRGETMKDEPLAEIVTLLSGAGAGKPSAFPLIIAAENGWSKTAEKLIAAGAPVVEAAAEFQKPNYSTEQKRRAMKLLGL